MDTYIKRHAEATVEKLSRMFGAVIVAGPRLSLIHISSQIEIEGAELNEITFTLNGETYTRILAFKDNSANYSGE